MDFARDVMPESDDPSNPRLIPQELVDLIIDNLHTDKPALKTCSLVARAWVARSRYHLFHKVEILNHAQLDAWTRLFPYPGASIVADLVRRLYIDQPDMLEDVSRFSLEQFRNLVHFSLGNTSFRQATESGLRASAMDNIHLLPASLRGFHLGIKHIYTWHITSLCGHFQDLDDFSVHNYTLRPGHQGEGVALVSSPKFRGELRATIYRDPSALLDLLTTLPDGVKFSRVNLTLPFDTSWRVSVWLPSVAETLTSLHIDTTLRIFSRSPPRADAVIDLSPLLKLTTFCLRFKPTCVLPSAVALIIESAPSNISNIELTFVGSKPIREWLPLDGAIVALASRCSQAFQVRINGIEKGNEVRVLPQASSMGLLQVGWGGLKDSRRYLVRKGLEDFREALFVKQLGLPGEASLTRATDILPDRNITSIICNFGAIVSIDSLVSFLYHSRHLRPHISDLFTLICKYQDQFGFER
ncbi:hypothetical protein BDM02DRAFT_3120176 [Thelephora ganbajun]|uniref:Uncharacterized protein n=1 Tax=Thelephora ganbajun TaxID=370292 RepID=A0ACB6Z7C2_THEGA|nr:hypothetical protein BDM02DRAFT_3120176 [Thelephora ganbajun]